MATPRTDMRWLTTSALSFASETCESTIRFWTQRKLLDHVKTTTGQAIYPPVAVKQARALRARRKR